jgi:hypothetical protein
LNASSRWRVIAWKLLSCVPKLINRFCTNPFQNCDFSPPLHV